MNNKNVNIVIDNLKKQLAEKQDKYKFVLYRKVILDTADTIFKYDNKSKIDIYLLPDVNTHRISTAAINSTLSAYLNHY